MCLVSRSLGEQLSRHQGLALQRATKASNRSARDGLQNNLSVALDEPDARVPALIPKRRRIRAGITSWPFVVTFPVSKVCLLLLGVILPNAYM